MSVELAEKYFTQHLLNAPASWAAAPWVLHL